MTKHTAPSAGRAHATGNRSPVLEEFARMLAGKYPERRPNHIIATADLLYCCVISEFDFHRHPPCDVLPYNHEHCLRLAFNAEVFNDKFAEYQFMENLHLKYQLAIAKEGGLQ